LPFAWNCVIETEFLKFKALEHAEIEKEPINFFGICSRVNSVTPRSKMLHEYLNQGDEAE